MTSDEKIAKQEMLFAAYDEEAAKLNEMIARAISSRDPEEAEKDKGTGNVSHAIRHRDLKLWRLWSKLVPELRAIIPANKVFGPWPAIKYSWFFYVLCFMLHVP